jgi:hypothetical protein
MNKLYAFWSYDLFPYLLGGPVDRVLPGKVVKVKNYGGSTFCWEILMPLEEGLKMQRELDQLAREYDNEIKQVKQEFKDKRDKLLTRYQQERPLFSAG